jgi:RNA polymerase sigma-70 factor, ECF subfamily
MLELIPQLRAFAISLCRNADQADDLVQDTLLRAWANIGSFTPGTSMWAWLSTILRNQFFSECRRRRRKFEPIEDHADSIVSKPTQAAHAECREVCSAVAKLEARQRDALIMVGVSGLSYEEAAKACGCPTGTMKSRVNRARTELTRLFSIEGPEHLEDDRLVAAVSAEACREPIGT